MVRARDTEVTITAPPHQPAESPRGTRIRARAACGNAADSRGRLLGGGPGDRRYPLADGAAGGAAGGGDAAERWAGARYYYERTLAIREQKAPRSRAMARSLEDLATVAEKQGDKSAAASYRKRAQALQGADSPAKGTKTVAGPAHAAGR